MQKLTRVKFDLFKTDDGNFVTRDLNKLNRALDKLESGKYTITIEMSSIRLDQMKKYYFVMHDKLAAHLGYTKKEMYVLVQSLFRKLDTKREAVDHDGMVYDSVQDVKDEEVMMERIIQFQVWASEQFNYTMEPFRDEGR